MLFMPYKIDIVGNIDDENKRIEDEIEDLEKLKEILEEFTSTDEVNVEMVKIKL